MNNWNFKYDVLETTGHTPFGTLYRGCNIEQQSEVGILEISQYLRDDKATFEDVWNTVIASSKIVHDLLVPVIDVDKARGWVIMEKRGDNLETVLGRQKLTPNAVRTILRDMLGLLGFFEEKKHIHGDIRPATLLLPAGENPVTEDRRVKLGFSPGVSICGEIPISHRDSKYLAPEMINHEFGELGTAADLYCLGFAALELLTGRDFDRFFARVGQDRDALWYTWHGNLSETLPSPRDLVPDLDEDLNLLLKSLLHKYVAERPASAKEALAMLKNVEPEQVLPARETPMNDMNRGPGRPDQGDPAVSSDFSSPVPPSIPAPPESSPRSKSKNIPKNVDEGGSRPWSKEWIDEQAKKPWVIALLVVVFFVPAIFLGLQLQQPGKKKQPKANKPAIVEQAFVDVAKKTDLEKETSEPEVTKPEAAKPETAKPETSVENKAGKYFLEGNALFDSYDYGRAIEKYDLALKEKPDHFEALCRKGRAEFELGDYEKSLAALDSAIEGLRKTDSRAALAEAYCARSRLWRMKGNWKRLEEDLNSAIQSDKTYGEAYLQRASFWRLTGNRGKMADDFKQARKLFEEQVKNSPKDVMARLKLARAQAAGQDYDDAMQTLEAAEKLAPRNATVFLVRANVLRQQKNYDLSIKEIIKSLTLHKDFHYAYRFLGMTYMEKGEFDSAVHAFEDLIRLSPKNPVGYRLAGEARFKQDKIDDAMKYYQTALTINPGDPFALVGRGECHVRKSNENGKYDKEILTKALQDFEASISADVDPSRAYFNRGKAFALLGEFQKARDDFELSAKIDPDSTNAFLNLGLMENKLGHASEAIAALDRAVELCKENREDRIDVYFNRGVLFAGTGKQKKAIEDFTTALSLKPDKDVYYHLALAWKSLSDFEKATEACNRAIELDDRFVDAFFLRGTIAFEQRSQDPSKLEHAVSDLTTAIDILDKDDPKSAAIRYARGMLYGFLNENGKARDDFKEALRFDKDNIQYLKALERIDSR